MNNALTSLHWNEGAIDFIDQRLLPHETVVRRAQTADDVIDAIRTLAVRGAPCIGIFGAYGAALVCRAMPPGAQRSETLERLRAARPTAVNLRWAIERVERSDDPLGEAQRIHAEQHAVDAAIARHGSELVAPGATILTHCNTGPLATGGGGTALGVILQAARDGKRPRVFAGETRPLLQGSRLTQFELASAGIENTLIVDAAAAITMQRHAVDLVIVGADRVARNGDTANKIGTLTLAVLAAHFGVPLYVAAPRSSFDFTCESGAQIPIEERDAAEVGGFAGVRAAQEGAAAYNPAFDVTPGHLVTAFITEYGVFRAPYAESIPDLESRPNFAVVTGA